MKFKKENNILELEMEEEIYYLYGSDEKFFSDVLKKERIDFKSLKSVLLNPESEIWIIGDLIEHIKKQQINATN